MKGLPPGEIDEGMREIDEEEYLVGLRELLRQKARSVRAASSYERNGKLTRYAVGKGFTLDEVLGLLQELPGDESAD